MPDPGFFIIHKWAEPPLKAGDYVLHAEHTVGGHAAQPLDSRIEVTSPRYALPPDQLLGVYPPANANGEFANRLPQIVIKRRTLPWERDADPDPAHPGTSKHPHHPWLALVVLRADECTLKTDVKVEDAVTAGVTLPGHRDVDQCTTVDVGESVVDAVFPTVDELPLLCHCREVDVRDTELAMGDDDGFLAVVLSNRLPMADVVIDADGNSVVQPVRYLACLVNLEHQFANLPQVEPPDRPPVFEFDSRALAVETMFVRPEGDPDHIAVQNPHFEATVALESAAPFLMAVEPAAAGGAGPAVAGGAGRAVAGAVRPAAAAYTASDWQTSTRLVEEAATARVDAGARVRKAIVEEFAGPSLIRMPLERRFRFPVLAYWTFTTTGVGGFDAYMEGLDVGLLGTQPPPPKSAPAPKHGPPPSAPPAPPRPPLETVDTGHIGLPHLTRRGDHTRAWYRGPFVPRPTDRPGLDADGRYPLAHVSDQLRVMTPDGREDVSRAAAFEIGRLMALSQPSIVASLLRWRTEQFGGARARSAGQASLRTGFLAGSVLASDLGRLATHRLLDAIGDAPEKVIAPVRPVVDPGRPLRYVDEGDELGMLARGLGVDAALLDPEGRAASQRLVDLATATIRVGDVQGGVSSERLDAALRADVSRVAEDINRSKRVPGGPLSHLIDEEPQP